jgi:hypothetical protein
MKKAVEYIIISVIIAIFFLASCEEIIEFRGEMVEPKIVMYSLFDPDSLILVSIGRSFSVFEEDNKPEQISNAALKLYCDGEFLSELEYMPLPPEYVNDGLENLSRYVAPDIRPEPGRLYRIEAGVPGLQSVWAEVQLPEPVAINNIDTFAIIGDYQVRRIGTRVRFNDPAGEDNYYRLNVSMIEGSYTGLFNEPWSDEYTVWVNTEDFTEAVIDDPLLMPPGDEDIFGMSDQNHFHIFSDELISGKDYDLNLRVFAWEKDYSYYEFIHYRIELQSISKDLFLYLRSMSLHFSSGESPFVEPVIVYSNVVNGLGIVGARICSSSTLKFGEYPVDGVPYEYSSMW